MATLLTADTAAVFSHVLIDILVAHSGLGVADALLIKSLIQTKVGHDRGNDGIGQQLATLLHVAAVDVQNMVASDDIALFIHTQATVSIAVIGKTDVQPLFYHELLQALDVGGTCIVVDIQSVGLCIDDVGVSAQRIEHRLSDVPGTAVGAVQTDLDALEGIDSEADQIAHVAVAARHIVHSAADVLTMSKGQLRPVLIEYMELSVNVILNQQQDLLRHLLAIAVDQLDAVIVVGIMAGRNHDAAVEVVHSGDVCNTWRSSDMQQISVRTGSGQACNQTVLEHIGATTSVLADYNACRIRITVALTQSVVIPAQKTTNLVGVVSGQSNSSFSTESIGSKILSHYSFSHPKSDLTNRNVPLAG